MRYVNEIVNDLIWSLREYILFSIDSVEKIKEDLENITIFLQEEMNVNSYINKLNNIKELIDLDVEMILISDPAVKSRQEVILCYPGLYAILIYRCAHEMALDGCNILARLLSEYAHSKTGIDIHPKANIGHHFFIDHGTGIVIGETSNIGNYVKIYQGVTLGAISLENPKLLSNVKRHPTIMDNVTIYANACILGGKTIIGKNSIIGCNVFITKSVKENSIITFNKMKEM